MFRHRDDLLRFEAAVRLEERVEAAVGRKDWGAGYTVYTQIKVSASLLPSLFPYLPFMGRT